MSPDPETVHSLPVMAVFPVGNRTPAAVNWSAYGFATGFQGSPVDLMLGIDGALYVLKLDGSITRISVP